MTNVNRSFEVQFSIFVFYSFLRIDRKNFLFFQALHGPNVLGTQNVLLFACANKIKPLHYIR